MSQTKKKTSIEYHRNEREKSRKAKADKVRINLDKYHEEMGGLFTKKVIFYCMPWQTGKTKKAIKKFEEYGGPEKGQFITITDGSYEVTHGSVSRKDQDIVIDDSSFFIIIDNIHLLSAKKITSLLNDFRQSIKTTKMVCFGTNADMEGNSIRGARHLENMADQVIYDTSACKSCSLFGRTCFTKVLLGKHQSRSLGCRVPDSDDDIYYYERDLCFDCRKYKGD